MIIMLIPKIEPLKEGVIVGGSANSLLTLVRSLLLHNVKDIKIISSLPSSKIPYLEKILGENIHHQFFKNNYKPQTVRFGLLFFLKSIVFAFVRHSQKTEIVHGHSGYAVYSIVTYFFSLITGGASIHTIYCPLQRAATVDNRTKIILKSKVSLFFLKKMDKIIAMSQNIASSLIESGIDRKKVITLPPAIDTVKFNPSNDGKHIREELNISSASEIILYVGNLMHSKGLHVLVEAFANIIKQKKNCHLIITLELEHDGFEERKHRLQTRIANLNMADKVIILGAVENMPSLMAASDIFVTPYIDTQGPSDYPLAMMEAMATGKCVIGTRVGGIPELLSDNVNGILVRPAHIEDLTNALHTALSSSDIRNRLGAAARKSIEENFTMTRVANAHLKLYSTFTDFT